MVLSTVAFAVAAILAALAAFYTPPSPPRVGLLALAVSFLALGMLADRLVPA